MNLSEMTWADVDSLSRDTPIVFPIAANEQHGRHMPLFTDSLLLEEVMRRVQTQSLSENILVSPLQWFGNSHHHMDMPGTLSASPRLYLDLLKNLAECFLVHGFVRIIFVNGHGGNITPSEQALFELRQQYRDREDLLLLSLTYWDSANPNEKNPELIQNEMGHAGEWETSMMLRVRPDLVQGDVKQVAEIPFGNGGAPGYRSWTMADRSEPGHIGTPGAATVEKGEALFDCFAAGAESYLQKVVDWNGEKWDL
ncbi:MAG: creatininase family protein [Planctomycetaceae bacterium]|nr:creatininase family protein [Planctomycetaceae bacterium]